MEWNVLVTAFIRKERVLLPLLREFGEFQGSGFRDVIIGAVENRDGFFEAVERLRREHPGRVRHLSRLAPMDRTFRFDVADLREKLKEALTPCANALVKGSTFFIRVRRRGHKGELSSLEIEQEMSGFSIDLAEKAGRQVHVRFEEPDTILIVETIGNRAGVGIITRAMRERCAFIRVK